MKCHVCGKKVEYTEIYTDWYFCFHCDNDYKIDVPDDENLNEEEDNGQEN